LFSLFSVFNVFSVLSSELFNLFNGAGLSPAGLLPSPSPGRLRSSACLRRGSAALGLACAFFLTACGSSSQDVLYIETPTSVIKVGERISLTAQATEVLAGPPEWDVRELEGGSLTRTTGYQVTYMAPLYAGTYQVTARAARTNGQRVRASQLIIVQPQLVIEPASVKVAAGGAVAFSVITKGIEPPQILWSVDEPGGGSVSQTGLYTAPSKPGYYHVTATAQTEWQPSATAAVRVE
jgi:hypothetical protein